LLNCENSKFVEDRIPFPSEFCVNINTEKSPKLLIFKTILHVESGIRDGIRKPDGKDTLCIRLEIWTMATRLASLETTEIAPNSVAP